MAAADVMPSRNGRFQGEKKAALQFWGDAPSRIFAAVVASCHAAQAVGLHQTAIRQAYAIRYGLWSAIA